MLYSLQNFSLLGFVSITALKYFFMSCYFLLVQSQKSLLFSTVTRAWAHKKRGLCHIMRTENSHNLLAQLSSHKCESERNSLLLTPSTPQILQQQLPWHRWAGALQAQHSVSALRKSSGCPIHNGELHKKLSLLMGTPTLRELKTCYSQQTLRAVSVQMRELSQRNTVFPVPFLVFRRV